MDGSVKEPDICVTRFFPHCDVLTYASFLKNRKP